MKNSEKTNCFVSKARLVHGNKYDYSKVEYVNYKTKVCIICPIHGEFWQTPNDHLSKKGCPSCGGTKRLTLEEFIAKANDIHNNFYNYSTSAYKNSKTKIEIICPKHGSFFQTPNDHLSGKGCPLCKSEKSRKNLFGVGTYDIEEPMTSEENFKIYCVWRAMLSRCYSEYTHKKQPTYIDCSVCNSWHSFKNFKDYYLINGVKEWCLDKDILVKGNKIYSPETCCFVPNEINILFSHKKRNSNLPIGIKKAKNNKYSSSIKTGNKESYLGTFNTPEEAFQVYKKAKEDWIKELANRWKDKLKPNVYEALMNYQVEITD